MGTWGRHREIHQCYRGSLLSLLKLMVPLMTWSSRKLFTPTSGVSTMCWFYHPASHMAAWKIQSLHLQHQALSLRYGIQCNTPTLLSLCVCVCVCLTGSHIRIAKMLMSSHMNFLIAGAAILLPVLHGNISGWTRAGQLILRDGFVLYYILYLLRCVWMSC